MAHPGGRPTKYKKKYCKEIVAFFQEKLQATYDDNKEETRILPTLQGFANKIGVDKVTLHNWKNSHPEFLNAVQKAKAIQEEVWMQNSLNSRYNTPFTIFLGKNVFGWTDKQEVQHKISIEEKIKAIESKAPKQLENVTVEDAE